MFGFPVNLQDSGVQKLTNDANSGFQKIQQKEIFYSIKDGAWDDPATWQTASGRVGLLPTFRDDVYIRNTIATTNDYVVNNMFFSGAFSFIATNRTLTINGNLTNYSTFSWTSGTSAVIIYGNIISHGTLDMSNGYELALYGNDNFINKNKFITGGSVGYYKVDGQTILDLPYTSLNVQGGGLKLLQNDLLVLGNFTCRPLSRDQLTLYNLIFDIGDFGFTINGTSYILALLRRPTSKKILFIGNVAFQGGYELCIDFSGNPEVEFRGGINTSYNNNFINMNSGTGKWRFTTNNQSIVASPGNNSYLSMDAEIEIDPGITLTQSTGLTLLRNKVNGLSSTSKLENRAGIVFANAASVPSMTTGIVDFTTFANTIYYGGNYTATIPSHFTTFRNLTISGTGIKSLGVNTTLNGNLIVSDTSNLELLNFNFVVNGTTRVGGSSIASGLLSKNGSGSVLFVGLVDSQVNGSGQKGIDFSGNPSVELRGGLTFYTIVSINSGTGTWTFTTNNQVINALASQSTTFTCDFIISGSIQVQFIQGIIGVKNFNGTSISSTLLLGGNGVANSTMNFTTSAPLLMSTGVLDNSTWANTIGFIMPGNYTIPLTTFRGMSVGGGGVKTLSGNTIVNNNYFNNDQSTILELSTFDFSVLGIAGTGVSFGARISKSGAGNVLFVGKLLYQYIDLSIGNPSVEFRNGFELATGESARTFKTGIGVWSFTTNNQFIDNYLVETYDCAISIASGITLQMNKQNNLGAHTFNGVLDGVSGTSKFLMFTNAQINYRNATQPMATGILDTSTNLNTWIYGNANQDIKGLPTTSPKQVYRNLTLNGGGTKTLQGYVSVLNTYTLTSPATLNNNGFTLTNP